jgi:hypothetical protein
VGVDFAEATPKVFNVERVRLSTDFFMFFRQQDNLRAAVEDAGMFPFPYLRG